MANMMTLVLVGLVSLKHSAAEPCTPAGDGSVPKSCHESQSHDDMTYMLMKKSTVEKASGSNEVYDTLMTDLKVDNVAKETHDIDDIGATFIDFAHGPDLTVGEEARLIVDGTNSGGLVSTPRKMATVNLALKALSVSGDFVETGVYNGGTAVLMAMVLNLKNRNNSRRLWAADSFAGLPKESQKEIAREDRKIHKDPGTTTIDGQEVRTELTGSKGVYSSARGIFEQNLEANGLGNSTTNPQIKVLQGWFNETLPSAPIQKIAFLRLDGDIYASTMDALTSLYDKVVPGGYIYVDDYGSYIGCELAINDFRKQRGITEPMYPISECGGCGKFEALWWHRG